jgi:hypothetical protein
MTAFIQVSCFTIGTGSKKNPRHFLFPMRREFWIVKTPLAVAETVISYNVKY